MNKPNKAGLSCFTGCGTVLLVVILCGYLLILSMCRVPKETYKPYMESGSKYYQTILGVSPMLSHDSQYADEAGGFMINVKFTEEQMKNPKVNLYTKGSDTIGFRATTTKPNIVGISVNSTRLLESSNSYIEFNEPVSNLLDNLLSIDDPDSEINMISNNCQVRIYSTDLNFWKNVISQYEKLKTMSFNEKFKWVSNQTNKNTYFYISTDTYITGYAPDVLKDDVFPIKEFPIGTIYSIRSTIDNTRTLYESDENYNLIESRHDYPVTY